MSGAGTLKVLLLAHDLSDAAVARRAAMLLAGGAKVTVAGFRRTPEPIETVAGCRAIDFGQTYSAGFAQRIISVLREIVLIQRHQALFTNADIIIARNLEMLAIAVRGRAMCRPTPSLIYECLDIHRLLLRRDFVGVALRALEGWLSRQAVALFTSSPAFVNNYFNRLSKVHLPVRLVENKVLGAGDGAETAPDITSRQPGPPWIIGWFGVIRCRKSLQILTEAVHQGKGTIEVVIRGHPARELFENFDKTVSETPGLRFLGPYKNPNDLAAIYSDVHFTWAIDMFEEGLNSSWLLPNRLYEGGAFGSVPIALESVEAGHFLKRLGLGVTLAEPLNASLEKFFNELTPDRYRALEDAAQNASRSTWVYNVEDCKALVEYMRSLTNGDGHG